MQLEIRLADGALDTFQAAQCCMTCGNPVPEPTAPECPYCGASHEVVVKEVDRWETKDEWIERRYHGLLADSEAFVQAMRTDDDLYMSERIKISRKTHKRRIPTRLVNPECAKGEDGRLTITLGTLTIGEYEPGTFTAWRLFSP